ncbi:hypothetical protein PBY51_009055 [Eleginops maclovinus]|uniref:Interferon gamma n=1 Tax=Eleginops maclovinus TaxID=56733 RepID=A0AAN7WTR6_ELEMC|nr:hypothetical protein PBY51_009055 [Eleginops maclovinus]
MSSCWGSICFLAFLGVAFVSGRPLEDIKNAQESIAEVLNLKGLEVGLNPLFSAVIKSNSSIPLRVNEMNATLDVYRQIFSSILSDNHSSSLLKLLNTTTRKSVRSDVEKLQGRITTLTEKFGPENNNSKDILSKLKEIKVGNHLVQRKALAEFLEVDHAADVILSPRV